MKVSDRGGQRVQTVQTVQTGQAGQAVRVVGPGFNRRVYAVVRQVPSGWVTTYGDVATVLGSPRVARHVGFALAALGEEDVPWHRVINSRGHISFKGDVARGGLQRALLRDEDVVFDGEGRVDLRRYRWTFAADAAPPVAGIEGAVGEAAADAGGVIKASRASARSRRAPR